MLRRHQKACRDWRWPFPGEPYVIEDHYVADKYVADRMLNDGVIAPIEADKEVTVILRRRGTLSTFSIMGERKQVTKALLDLGDTARLCRIQLRREYRCLFERRHPQGYAFRELRISSEMAGWAVGIDGCTINRIERQFNVWIESNRPAMRGQFFISGTLDEIESAINEFVRVIQNKPTNRARIGKAHTNVGGVKVSLIGEMFVQEQRLNLKCYIGAHLVVRPVNQFI